MKTLTPDLLPAGFEILFSHSCFAPTFDRNSSNFYRMSLTTNETFPRSVDSFQLDGHLTVATSASNAKTEEKKKI